MNNCLTSFIPNYNTAENNADELKALLLQDIVKFYNKKARQYTGGFNCNISCPKDRSHMPNEFMSFSDYLRSKKIWIQILNFINKNSDIEDLHDYIDVMIRNWRNIENGIGCKIKKPTATIIFSSKLTFLYSKFKKIEKDKETKNQNIVMNLHDKKIDRLSPSMQSDYNSLYRLKNINSGLTYKDVLNIFKAEFSEEFLQKTKDLTDIEIEKMLWKG